MDRSLDSDVCVTGRWRAAARCAATLAAILWAAQGLAAGDLAGHLRELAATHGFRIEGIEKLGDQPAVAAAGDLNAQLRALLAGYDHVVEGVPPAVQRVIVIGPRQPAGRGVAVDTTRRNGHHLVRAGLEGAAGHRASVELMVDTGASSVVLPESMIAPLGFRAAALTRRRSQTANGTVTGRSARLASVSVGGAVARDVAVLFVADDRLGGVSLLGMSFLERFSMAIDGPGSRLVLTPR